MYLKYIRDVHHKFLKILQRDIMVNTSITLICNFAIHLLLSSLGENIDRLFRTRMVYQV